MITDAQLARGTRAAVMAPWVAAAWIVVLMAICFQPAVSADTDAILLVWTFGGLMGLLHVATLRERWWPANVEVTDEGFTRPRRRWREARAGEQGALIRWADVRRAVFIPRMFGGSSPGIAVQTTNGWVHRIRESAWPAQFPRLKEALRDKLEVPGEPDTAETAVAWNPALRRD